MKTALLFLPAVLWAVFSVAAGLDPLPAFVIGIPTGMIGAYIVLRFVP